RLTWGYDSAGRPASGWYGSGSDRVTIAWSSGSVTTTDALGTQRTRTFGTVGPRAVITGLQTQATADSAATAWSFSHDGNGNLAGVVTRTGEVQTYSADARGRVIAATRAAGSSIALPAQLTWHPVFHKPTQVLRAGV